MKTDFTEIEGEVLHLLVHSLSGCQAKVELIWIWEPAVSFRSHPQMQGPKELGHPWLSSQAINTELNQMWSSRDTNSCPHGLLELEGRGIACYASMLAPKLYVCTTWSIEHRFWKILISLEISKIVPYIHAMKLKIRSRKNYSNFILLREKNIYQYFAFLGFEANRYFQILPLLRRGIFIFKIAHV